MPFPRNIQRRFILFLFIFGLSFSFNTKASSSSQPAAQGLASIRFYLPIINNHNSSIFGASLSSLNSDEEIQKVASAGLAWTRIEIDWVTVEPTYGSWDWSKAAPVDQALQAVIQAGLEPILILGGTPSWAIKPYFSCGTIREDYFPEFVKFAQEAVRRYSASPYNVKHYEIYNEPDAAGIFGCWGDPQDVPYYGGLYYGKFLQYIYPEIKRADPEAQVLVGGLLMDCDPINPPINPVTGIPKNCMSTQFFDGILASGAGDSFDGVAFHSYDYYMGPGNYHNPNWHSQRSVNGSSSIAKAAYLRATMQKYNIPQKPLFDTEFALFCGEVYFNTCETFQADLEATKAYYAVQFVVNAIADDFQAAIWYRTVTDYVGRNVSLLKPDYTPLPVFNAYKFINKRLGNARYFQQISNENFIIHEFKKGNVTIWVVWTKDIQAHTLQFPSVPRAMYQVGSDGNARSLTPADSITLDMAPAVIEWVQ